MTRAFILILLFSLRVFAIVSESLQYCVPVEKIDFNPFREIVDGKDLAYLMLLRSYISTDSSEVGILSKYDFSPDGRVFIGRIEKGLKWRNGQSLTAKEAAFGIAKALGFRTLGKRVRVVGTEDINKPGWMNREYPGVEIIDEYTFKLKFSSDIENITGVVREALSTNSRHNRFWPVKLQLDGSVSNPEVLLKFPSISIEGQTSVFFEGNRIEISNIKSCNSPSFSIFSNIFAISDKLIKKSSPVASAVTVQVNSKMLAIKDRLELISWLRGAFASAPKKVGFDSVDSFFLPGEVGYNQTLKWPKSDKIKIKKNRKIVIAFEIPIFKEVVEKFIDTKNKNSIQLVPLPSSRKDIDAQILASGMIEGRHVILQDILKWPHVNDFFNQRSITKKNLIKIAEMSASTMPPDSLTLMTFEKEALKEFSLAPIARRYPVALSKEDLKIYLDWSSKGEITFKK